MNAVARRGPDRLLAEAARRVDELQRGVPAAADLRRAGLCVQHQLSCALRGRDLPWSRAAALSFGRAAGPADSAFVGAVMGQSTLGEDLHPASLVHPGSVVVPAALAAASGTTVAGEEADGLFLAGVLAGYDVMCRIGTAMKTEEFVARGFRPTAVFGPFGAAAVFYRLDVATTQAALAIAANTAAGLREWANAGSTDVYLQNGFAARNGLLAAQLAAHGATGPDTVLEGPAGMGCAFSGGQVDWLAAVRAFDQGAAAREVVFKRYPACSAVQTVLELAERMGGQHSIDPRRVDRVVVFTHRHGKNNPGCDSEGPWLNLGQAQMSNQLGVALALSGVPLDVKGYLGHYQAPHVEALARRVEVVEDPALTRDYPQRSGARIEVRLSSGRPIVDGLVDSSPLTAAEVEALFRDAVNGAGDGVVARAGHAVIAGRQVLTSALAIAEELARTGTADAVSPTS